jgi:hypothetical protein
MDKIDEHGNYRQFPGVTVVSMLSPPLAEAGRRLFEVLRTMPSLVEHYSLLPVASYHMTLINLYTERWDTPAGPDGSWANFIDSGLPWFRQLGQALNAQSLKPRIRVAGPMQVSSIMYLPLQLSDDAQKDCITGLADSFGIRNLIPPEFHITLGYNYRRMTQEAMQVLRAEVERRAGGIIEELRLLGTFELETAHLCSFHDMTEFSPWDAERSPFFK